MNTLQLPDYPPSVPTNLQTAAQRCGGPNGIWWMRTWYGNDDVSKQEADDSYAKLCKHVTYFNEEVELESWTMEDEDLFADRVSGPTVTGVTPFYVQDVFNQYPNLIDHGEISERELEFSNNR